MSRDAAAFAREALAAGGAPASGGVAPARSGEPSRPLDEKAKRALAWILRSTDARPQTEAEIAAKLAAKGYEDEIAALALGEAKRIRAIDDAAFAQAWIEDRGEKRGYGTNRLRQELRRRMVPEPLIASALARLDERDDLAVATELARQRAGRMPATLGQEAVGRRLVGFLVRRGYPPGLAQRVAREVSGLDRTWD